MIDILFFPIAFEGCFTGYTCETNPKDLGNAPSGVISLSFHRNGSKLDLYVRKSFGKTRQKGTETFCMLFLTAATSLKDANTEG